MIIFFKKAVLKPGIQVLASLRQVFLKSAQNGARYIGLWPYAVEVGQGKACCGESAHMCKDPRAVRSPAYSRSKAGVGRAASAGQP